MERYKLDSISIKSPCNESWDEMSGNDDVRFCSHCAKNVYDLSAITLAEVKKLIEGSKGNLCVRFVKTPQGKLATALPKTSRVKRHSAIAAGVLASSLVFSTLTYAQDKTMGMMESPNQSQKNNLTKAEPPQSFSTISGEVRDENGAVIPKAKITLRDSKTQKIRTIQSNDDGFYEFQKVESGIYQLEVEANGFEILTLKDIKIIDGIKLDKVMILKGKFLMGVVNTSIDNDASLVNINKIKPSNILTLREPVQLFGMPEKKKKIKKK